MTVLLLTLPMLLLWLYLTFQFYKKENGTSPVFAKGDNVFSVGEQVTAFGNVGTVKSISSNGMFVEASFPDSQTTVVFTIDGKVHSWNKQPSLRKIAK